MMDHNYLTDLSLHPPLANLLKLRIRYNIIEHIDFRVLSRFKTLNTFSQPTRSELVLVLFWLLHADQTKGATGTNIQLFFYNIHGKIFKQHANFCSMNLNIDKQNILVQRQ